MDAEDERREDTVNIGATSVGGHVLVGINIIETSRCEVLLHHCCVLGGTGGVLFN